MRARTDTGGDKPRPYTSRFEFVPDARPGGMGTGHVRLEFVHDAGTGDRLECGDGPMWVMWAGTCPPCRCPDVNRPPRSPSIPPAASV